MPVRYYPASIEGLSDEELKRLRDEIEASGVLRYSEDWDEDEWEAQACRRWYQIQEELDQRHPKPKGSGLSLAQLDAYTRTCIVPQLLDAFHSNPLLVRLVRRKP